jgi:exodeoxyribonuclease VII large subunit
LEANLAGLAARLRACTTRNFDRKRQAMRAAARALPSPDQLLALPRRHFDEVTSRLSRALIVSTERKRARLSGARLTIAMLARRAAEARRHLDRVAAQLPKCADASLRDKRRRLEIAQVRISPEPLLRRHAAAREAMAGLQRRLDHSATIRLQRMRVRLTQAERLLMTLSHQAVLERGFALVTDEAGALVKRAAEVAPDAGLSLTFADGKVGVTANEGGARPKPQPKPAARPKTPGVQGSLF